jgi:hypothetical protein
MVVLPDGKKTGPIRSFFRKGDGRKPEAVADGKDPRLEPRPVVSPGARMPSDTANSSEATAAEKKPGLFRNMTRKGDRKDENRAETKGEPAAKTEDRQPPVSHPNDWNVTDKGLRTNTLPETAARSPKGSDEPTLPHAKAAEVDPLARPSDFLKRPPVEKKSVASIPESKTVTAARQTEPQTRKSAKPPVGVVAGPAMGVAPVFVEGPMEVPPGAASVLASGSPQYVPVPIVTVPHTAASPVPPTPPDPRVPNAPQPNAGHYAPVNPQFTPPRGLANAFTRPGPERPVPAETIPPERTVNAFNDPPVEGQGVPPPHVPALLQHSPARGMLAGYPHGVPQLMPPRLPPEAQCQVPPGQQHQPVPGVALMPNPAYQSAAYFNMPQASQAHVYGMPQGGIPQGGMAAGYQPYQQPLQQAAMQPDADPQSNVSLLLKMLQESDYPSQREWAADQLAGQGMRSGPQVVAAIMAAARDDLAPMVRACCVRCLTRMGVQTMPMGKLLEDLRSDPDPRVRDAVQEASRTLGITAGQK